MLRIKRHRRWAICLLLLIGFSRERDLAAVGTMLDPAWSAVTLSAAMEGTEPTASPADQPAVDEQAAHRIPPAVATGAADNTPSAHIETDTQHESDEDAPDTFYRIYRVTAYCDRGVTAAGLPSGVGQCAAPADIPFGTRIYIPALDRTFVVTDRTHRRFRHNTVDLFIPSAADCKQFGRKYLECHMTLPRKTHHYGSRDLAAVVARQREAAQ